MSLTTSIPRIEEHRVTVVFDCPRCRSKVKGTAYDLRETIRFKGRIPRWGWQSHWVRCSKCNAELKSRISAGQLTGAPPSKVNEQIIPYHSFPKRFMSIASVVLSWTPLVGVLLGIIATVMTLRTRGWPKWLSIAGLILAATINAAWIGSIIHDNNVTATPLFSAVNP